MDVPCLPTCLEDWEVVTKDFNALESVNKEYLRKVEELKEIREKCSKGVAHQKYIIRHIKTSLKGLGKNLSEEEMQKVGKLQKDMLKRSTQLADIEENLPRKSGRYLRIVLGDVNVSLMNKQDRFKYKDEYEKFKLIVTGIAFLLSVTNYAMLNMRWLDLAFCFLLVWYYCTLTLRESILRVNGSMIKGWWRFHHFLSTVSAGVLLIWPETESYLMFRTQFIVFNCYIAIVQFLQFWYQQGCLYRLKALGERHNMDVTIEGFHSWMFRGLGFLLPFLFIGYAFELYNAYVLYQISRMEMCKEWQVLVLSFLFLLLSAGNTITTCMVIPEKQKNKWLLKYRFPNLWKKIRSGRSSPREQRRNKAAGDLSPEKQINGKKER